MSSRKKPDRRKGAVEAPVFGKLLVEAHWQPEDDVKPELQNWARSAGVMPDRRATERRSKR